MASRARLRHTCYPKCACASTCETSSINTSIFVAGTRQPLQDVLGTAEEALHWSYPLPQAKDSATSRSLTAVTKALADVGTLEDNVLDVTAAAHQIASHVLKLLQDPM